MFGLENRAETLIFMPHHFYQKKKKKKKKKIRKNFHFHFTFFPFWCTKKITGDCFMFKINKITLFKTKNGMIYSFQYVYNTFPKACFPY